MNQTQIRHLLALGWGIYGGIFAGYFLAKKKFQKIADEEIASVKETYKRRYKAEEFSTPESTAAKFNVDLDDVRKNLKTEEIIKTAKYNTDESVPKYSYGPNEFTEEEIEVIQEILESQVPEDDDDDEDEYEDIEEPKTITDVRESESKVKFEEPSEEEVETQRSFPKTVARNSKKPYVISLDEFSMDRLDHDKIILIYYSDEIIADERGTVVQDPRGVGEDFVESFGDRSSDPNIVYIRNERIKADFEIVREERTYVEAVLKINNKTPRGKRFHQEDD